jgi:tetratricopeptide (TPR) repeat protein
LNLNQTDQAAESFRRALELAPDYAAARFNLGFARLALGDQDAAREQARLLKTMDPELATELEALVGK